MGNSTRIGSGNTYGTVIAYTCPHGYYIGRSSESTYTGTRDVTATVHCQADKTWSAEPDDCLSECDLMQFIAARKIACGSLFSNWSKACNCTLFSKVYKILSQKLGILIDIG